MPVIVLLIVVVAVLLFLAKSVYDAQQVQGGAGRPDRPSRRVPRAPRPRRRRPVIDQGKLAEHVAKLRTAVAAGLVTREEAAASIVRQADGQLSQEAANQLLDARDAA